MLNKSDLSQIDKVVAQRIKNEIKPLKEDVSENRKDIKTLVGFFDKEYLDLRKRVERIGEHLNLPPVNQ